MVEELIKANLKIQIDRLIRHLGEDFLTDLKNSNKKLIIKFKYNPRYKSRRNVSYKYDALTKGLLNYHYLVSSYYRYNGYRFVVNKFLYGTEYEWLKNKVVFKGIKDEELDAIKFIKNKKVKIKPTLGNGDGILYYDGGGWLGHFRKYLLSKLIPHLTDELVKQMVKRKGLDYEGFNYRLLTNGRIKWELTEKSLKNIKTPIQVKPHGFNQLIIKKGKKKLIITYTYCLFGDQSYHFTKKAVDQGVKWILFSGSCGKLKNVNTFDNVKPVKFNFMPESVEIDELTINNQYPVSKKITNVNVQGIMFEFPIKPEGFERALTFEELRNKGDVVDVETALIALALKDTKVNTSISLVVTDDPEDINQLFRAKDEQTKILIEERNKKLNPIFNQVREKQFKQIVKKINDYFK